MHWPTAIPDFPLESLPKNLAPLMPPETLWTEAIRATQSRDDGNPSAVVMLFVPAEVGAADAQIVLMRRSVSVATHKGQISFAGGRKNPDDPTPVATALRELEEELGVPPAEVIPVGLLPPTPSMNRQPVFPLVALTTRKLSAMCPAPAEVAEVFAAPWRQLSLDRDQVFRFNIFGNWRTSHLFVTSPGPGAASNRIWGLTAAILHSAALA